MRREWGVTILLLNVVSVIYHILMWYMGAGINPFLIALNAFVAGLIYGALTRLTGNTMN